MRTLLPCCTSAFALLLVGMPAPARAQGAFLGAGLGATTVPRSLYALCASERRMNGPSVSAQAGYRAGRLRWVAGLDATARGYGDAAGCVARSGTAVDSVFAAGSSTVVTASADVWYSATNRLDVGAGAGWVPGHQSAFVSGGVGTQFRKLHVEIAARRHRTSFDVVTREYGSGTTREISRASKSEGSWGGLFRVVLVSR